MRTFTLFVFLAAVPLAACNLSSAPVRAGLSYPEKGVVCDPSAGFCSDAFGISLGLSQVHLGHSGAYKAFIARYSKDDYAGLQTQNYQFSDGTLCDHVEMWCGDPQTGEPNNKVAEALFAQ